MGHTHDDPMAKSRLVDGGNRIHHEGPIDIIPYEEALRGLPELLR